MQYNLRILRYLVLALVVICNAIIASVAIWNQSLVPADISASAIDVYYTCLGVLGLIFAFVIFFLELAGKDSMTGTVWFECSWVSAFFVVNLAGSSAASAILIQQSCAILIYIPVIDPCVSARTLLAFSWIVTIVLLMYAVTLISSVLLVRGEHPKVWTMHLAQVPRPRPKSTLSSEPSTPVLPHFTHVNRPLSIAAPAPRPFRIFAPSENLTQHLSGPSPEDVIDYFHPQAPSLPHYAQRPQMITDEVYRSPPSLYPQFIQSALQTPAGPPRAPPVVTPRRQGSMAQQPPSPPPLGDWPRRDILSQPVRLKRAKSTSLPNVIPDFIPANASQRPLGPRKMPTEGEHAASSELPES